MNNEYQLIDEAIYHVAGDQIVRKKRNPIKALLILILGIALIVAGYSVPAIHSNANLSSAAILIGGGIAIVGFVLTLVRLTGKGAPFYLPTGKKLRRTELFFETALRNDVCDCVRTGNFGKLAELPRSDSSALIAIIYRTDDQDIALAQVLEFVPHHHQPITDTLIFQKGTFTLSGELA